MLIDTHVHYNLEPLFSNSSWEKVNEEKAEQQDPGQYSQQNEEWLKPKPVWIEHWKEAQSKGVAKSIIVGTDFFSSTAATQIAEKSDGLFASVGCHPTNYHEAFLDAKKHKRVFFDSLFEDLETDLEELDLIDDDKKVVAIGETGLDYFRLPMDGEERTVVIDLQKSAFEKHIQLAQKTSLPLILHVRDKDVAEEKKVGNAYWDALDLLQKHNVTKFTLHCVSGPLSYVKAAIEMGGYMGFDGNITYPNAQQIRDIFALVPEDRRLVETDAPFLPPQEFRGQTCEPWMLTKTVEYIERELKVDQNTFTENARRLFKI